MLCLKRFLFILACLTVTTAVIPRETENIQKGKLEVLSDTCFFERTSGTLIIKNPKHQTVFRSTVAQKGRWIAGFGFNHDLQTFYAFHQSFSPLDTSYRLFLETDGELTVPSLKTDEPVYQPILLKRNGLYVAYITEAFKLVIRNLHTGEICRIFQFSSPVRSPREVIRRHKRIISYQKLHRHRFEDHSFEAEDLGIKDSHLDGNRGTKTVITGRPDIHPGNTGKYRQDATVLNYRKIVGFGDSITYGQIASEYHPELGYIPRLQELMDNGGFQVTVINEGLGNRKATTSFDEFTTALAHHRGKFLLLHLGTNDVRFWTIPVSDVVFAIQQMTDTALTEGVLPVLSTLIPRNHPIYFDILRHRGKLISNDIRYIAATSDLPMVDFWDLFLNYPDAEGGYVSLMSDDTHPSEKGYQLMAENWYPAVLRFPPDTPVNITKRSSSPRSITIQWDQNREFDIEHYLVEFGYTPNALNHRVVADSPEFVFIRYYFSNPLLNSLYYKISAVDRSGHIGAPTEIHTLDFESD